MAGSPPPASPGGALSREQLYAPLTDYLPGGAPLGGAPAASASAASASVASAHLRHPHRRLGSTPPSGRAPWPSTSRRCRRPTSPILDFPCAHLY